MSLTIVGLVAMIGVAVTSERPLLIEIHKSRGVTCTQCHKESPALLVPANDVCTRCHGDQEKLAARTATADPNPHTSPHLPRGATPICADCHHIHRPSEVSCSDCHRSFRFNVK